MTRDTSALHQRRRRNRSGAWGELVAAAFLIAKGYRILERRFKCPSGEIDLIARRGKRIAFIEVKKRASLAAAEASIGALQANRISNAADTWLSRHPQHQLSDIGFDIIFVVPGRMPQHLTNALL